MNLCRRRMLRVLAATGTLALTVLRPFIAVAADWNRAAFEAKNLADALQAADLADATPTQDILIKAPEIAENGAQVPVEITSNLPDTETLYVFVDRNPTPYAGSFQFLAGAEPFVSTRIKMGETSDIRVVARAGGKLYVALREVKVTIGGCGA